MRPKIDVIERVKKFRILRQSKQGPNQIEWIGMNDDIVSIFF